MKMIPETFGDRVLLARKHRGYSTLDLATNSGVSAQTVSSIELGKRKPTLETAQKLAEALGMSIDELAGRQ